MAVLNAKLGWLLDPFTQYNNLNGKPLTNGWIEVYYAGTNIKYITYQNFDGTENGFKVSIPSDGRVSLLAALEYHYDVYLYSEKGNLIASRLNVVPIQEAGNISITGKECLVVSEDGTVDVSMQTLPGNKDKFDLSIQNTIDTVTGDFQQQIDNLYSELSDLDDKKEDKLSWGWTVNGEISAINSSAIYAEAGITKVYHDSSLSGEGTNVKPLKVSPDYMKNYVSTGSFESYKDEVESKFDTKEDKITYTYTSGKISEINGSALSAGINEIYHDETLSGTGDKNSPLGVSPTVGLAVNETMTAYESGNNLIIGINDNYLNTKLDTKEDVITYGYNQNKITSINGSALSAGANYSAGTNIEIKNDTISITGKKGLQTNETINVERTENNIILSVNTDIVSGKDWSNELDQKENKITYTYVEI